MFTFLLGLFLTATAYAATPADSLLQQADAAYLKRSDFSEAKNALDLYQQGIAADPKNVEAHWKAARAAHWMGDVTESPRADKLNYFTKGIELAKAGIALDANSVESHFWLGANYGSYGETKGVLKSLSLVKPIRQEMAEVNRLNERFEGGSGYRVIGIVDYQVPPLMGGNKKRALEELQKSYAIDAQNPFTNYYLAQYYQVIGDKAKMKTQWDQFKALQVSEKDRPDYEVLLKKGKKAFEK